MSYRVILVQVDGSIHASARIETAAAVAAAQGAHLIGAAVTGMAKFLAETLALSPNHPDIAPYVEILRNRAEETLVKFEDIARNAGVVSWEKRLIDDQPAGAISLQARCCDLVVVGQTDPDEPPETISPEFPEYVLLNCGVPGLVVPYMNTTPHIGQRVLIAWNASKEAARALHDALPLLERAETVEVAIFNPEPRPNLAGMPLGPDIKTYLEQHHIQAKILPQVTQDNVGDALLTLAGHLGSDLVVMGCYGHSRFREVLLGGATRAVLRSSTVPLLMSH